MVTYHRCRPKFPNLLVTIATLRKPLLHGTMGNDVWVMPHDRLQVAGDSITEAVYIVSRFIRQQRQQHRIGRIIAEVLWPILKHDVEFPACYPEG